MNSTTVIGYTYGGSVYCPNCAATLPLAGMNIEDEDAYPIFCGSEWDYIPSCDSCFTMIEDVSLTQDGIKYVLFTITPRAHDHAPGYHDAAFRVLRRHGVDPNGDSEEEES